MVVDSLTVEPWALAAVAGPVIAVLTGLLTRLDARPAVKAWVSLGLTVAAATVTELLNRGVAFDVASAAGLFGRMYVAHVVAYQGALKAMGGGVAPGATTTEGVIG